MKEIIRQYAGTVIAALLCVLLVGIVANTRTHLWKTLPETTALTKECSDAFEGYWRSR